MARIKVAVALRGRKVAVIPSEKGGRGDEFHYGRRWYERQYDRRHHIIALLIVDGNNPKDRFDGPD